MEYLLGHMRQRAEGMPLLEAKFEKNLARRCSVVQQQGILDACADQVRLESMAVDQFVDLFIRITQT